MVARVEKQRWKVVVSHCSGGVEFFWEGASYCMRQRLPFSNTDPQRQRKLMNYMMNGIKGKVKLRLEEEKARMKSEHDRGGTYQVLGYVTIGTFC